MYRFGRCAIALRDRDWTAPGTAPGHQPAAVTIDLRNRAVVAMFSRSTRWLRGSLKRDEDRRVFDGLQAMHDIAGKAQQIAFMHDVDGIASRELDASFQTLGRQLPLDLVHWRLLARRQDNAKHLQRVGVVERARDRRRQLIAIRTNVDQFARRRMMRGVTARPSTGCRDGAGATGLPRTMQRSAPRC